MGMSIQRHDAHVQIDPASQEEGDVHGSRADASPGALSPVPSEGPSAEPATRNQFKLDETLESEALLIGRVTYESFAGAWPSREGAFADKFNTMPKYVVSSTLEDPPVILGTGRRLFGATTEKTDWRLTEARPVGPDDVLVLIYERAR